MACQNHSKSNKLNGEEESESETDHVYGSAVQVVRDKYTYNLKDASLEIRNKKQPNKKSFPSDTLILSPRDFKYCNR